MRYWSITGIALLFKMKIVDAVYIHGFNSGLKPNKLEKLSNVLNTDSDIVYIVHGVQWDSELDYRTNFNSLVEQINQFDNEVLLIGCSLGGFYARQIGNVIGCNVVLINPVVDPQLQLRCLIGQHTNYVTGKTYTFTQKLLNSYVIDSADRGNKLTYVSDNDSLLVGNGDFVEHNRYRFGHIIHTMTDHRVDDYNDLHDFKHQVDLLMSSSNDV